MNDELELSKEQAAELGLPGRSVDGDEVIWADLLCECAHPRRYHRANCLVSTGFQDGKPGVPCGCKGFADPNSRRPGRAARPRRQPPLDNFVRTRVSPA